MQNLKSFTYSCIHMTCNSNVYFILRGVMVGKVFYFSVSLISSPSYAAGMIGLQHAVRSLMHVSGSSVLHLRSINPHVGDLLAGSRGMGEGSGAWSLPRQTAGMPTLGARDPTKGSARTQGGEEGLRGISAFAFQVWTQGNA